MFAHWILKSTGTRSNWLHSYVGHWPQKWVCLHESSYLYSYFLEYSTQDSWELKSESNSLQCQKSTSIIHRKGGSLRNKAPGKLELRFNLVLQWESYKWNMNFKMSLLKERECYLLLFKSISTVAYSFLIKKDED